MLPVNNIDLSPKSLLRNVAAPQGPMPPASVARGGAEGNRIAGASLLTKTFRQVNTSRVSGVGGKVDLLG
ncbi:MAG: hypothetical protein HOE48_06855 [Candidatus Latescibacteria bacterium]|jgi:hypothetical protein|nr:hypothetical protein [Candidatus Latescibacterota bacterium]MBT5832811.1 hypothetical protein [Candidatus Latescibacterota bacterium]